MKNYKTTIAGIIGAIIVAGENLLPYFEGDGQVNWYQVSAALIIAVGGYLAKDHDKDTAEDVKQEIADEGPGSGGIKNPKPKP